MMFKYYAFAACVAVYLCAIRFSTRRANRHTHYEARNQKNRWSKGGVIAGQDTPDKSTDAYMLFGYDPRRGRWELIELTDVPAKTWEWHQRYGCDVPDIEYDTQESLMASLPNYWPRH